MHKINGTLESGSMIVLRNLKGINRNGKGRGFDRKLDNSFPHHRLSQSIEYRARWLRVLFIVKFLQGAGDTHDFSIKDSNYVFWRYF